MPSESKASMWIHPLKSVMWMLALMYITLLEGKGGKAADIAIYCPNPFREGQVNIITCTVNSTSIKNAGCAIPPSRLDITFAGPSSLYVCSSQYPPTSCGPSSAAQACFCAVNNTDVFTYQYNFVGNTAYDKGNFTCNICASPLNPPTPESQNCSTITLVTTSSSEAPVTTSSSETRGKSDDKMNTLRFTVIKVAFVILVLGVITVIAASVESETCEGWCCIANIVLGCFFIAMGVANVILTVLTTCACFIQELEKPTTFSQNVSNSESPRSRQGDRPLPASESPKKKHKKKKHRDSEESSLRLSELRSDSATSSESTLNGATASQIQAAPLRAARRPLPPPAVERKSAIDLLPALPVNKTLPPVITNLRF